MCHSKAVDSEESAGAPGQRRELPQGLTRETLEAAVHVILGWESGEIEIDTATDLAIELYSVLQSRPPLFSETLYKSSHSGK